MYLMDSMDKSFIAGCASFVIVIGAFIGACLYGHIYSTDKYNESMSKCIEARGSWIPSYGSSGVCIIRN